MKRQRKKKHGVLKVLRRIVLALVLIVALFFGAVTALEYRPNDTDALDVSGSAVTALKEGDSLTVMTWNIGFGRLVIMRISLWTAGRWCIRRTKSGCRTI